jgi:serine protease
MNRALLSLLLVLCAASLRASELHRWIVATRGPANRIAMARDLEGRTDRRFTSFGLVSGFAAVLSDKEVEDLQSLPDVRFVEPDREVHLLDMEANQQMQQTPYGIIAVDAPRVWAKVRGEGIRVGIIDTGIDMTHPDLAAAYRGGWNFIASNDSPFDDNGHGTHVAGTIAAADNTLGVIGVAPRVELYALKVLSGRGVGSTSSVIAAVEWAVTNHMNIISLSLGSPAASELEEEAFDAAAQAGVLAVAAAGNDGAAALSYPAAYPSVLAVGAVDSTEQIASFSNGGAGLALVAPGVRVYSTFPRGMARVSEIRQGESVVYASPLEGSSLGTVTGEVIDCGLGRSGDFPPQVPGRIALIQRGDLTFGDKTRNAMAAGAEAVIIANNVPGPFSGTLMATILDRDVQWPLVLSVSMEDGERLRAPSAPVTASFRTDDYATLSGTSMATPHVTGAAALVWSARPTASATEVREALTSTATDLGPPGRDAVYGFGLVDAFVAARKLAPELFPPSRRRSISR